MTRRALRPLRSRAGSLATSQTPLRKTCSPTQAPPAKRYDPLARTRCGSESSRHTKQTARQSRSRPGLVIAGCRARKALVGCIRIRETHVGKGVGATGLRPEPARDNTGPWAPVRAVTTRRCPGGSLRLLTPVGGDQHVAVTMISFASALNGERAQSPNMSATWNPARSIESTRLSAERKASVSRLQVSSPVTRLRVQVS